MAALSRNTASVAQDFHNAGGGDKISTIEQQTTSASIHQFNNDMNAYVFNTIIDDFTTDNYYNKNDITLLLNKCKNVSPPALNASIESKVRRTSLPSTSLNEKENNNDKCIKSKNSLNKLNEIREKHLTQMVSKKMSCKTCRRKNTCMVLPYHRFTTLLLHRIWRHSHQIYKCNRCDHSANKIYKLKLHMRLGHRSKIHIR